MTEADLLAHIQERSADLAAAFAHVLVGPGDDGAVVRSASGEALLLKVDQVVEGRHFAPIPKTPIDLVARKAIARPLSDIAAMGGTPSCALAAAVLPPACVYADELFDAMARWARHWSCPLVGGDVAAWGAAGPSGTAPSGLVLSVTVLGRPHPARGPVLRSTARPGDDVFVSGPIGGSLDPATGLGRHLAFEPRLAEARELCDALGPDLHAMIDLSDGLGIDAGRVARASGARIELDAGTIPLAPGVADWRHAAGRGEDYELLFAVGPASSGLVPAWASRIGRVVPGAGCVIVEPGRTIDVSTLGWDHGTA